MPPDLDAFPPLDAEIQAVFERACASGQAPTDREVVPVVVESATRVEITTLVAPVVGDATCPSNPWFPVTVELDDAVGVRAVVDMHMPPGVELVCPPRIDDRVFAASEGSVTPLLSDRTYVRSGVRSRRTVGT